MSRPIAVIGFNRPDYLRQVLASLRAQQGVEIERIALFQDGAANMRSGIRYAEDAKIAENIAVFGDLFPDGEVFPSKDNLGIAENINRAERWMFEDLDAEAGIIFEDDLVVTPHYIASLNRMIDVALVDRRIGYVACYGNHWTPLIIQEIDPIGYIRLDFNWGFGITKRQYEANKPYLDQYLTLIRARDYLQPDEEALRELLLTWDVRARLLPVQDAIRNAICWKTGAIKLNTNVCLGKYIGAKGVHHDQGHYDNMEYGETELYRKPITRFPLLADDFYQDTMTRQYYWLKYGRA